MKLGEAVALDSSFQGCPMSCPAELSEMAYTPRGSHTPLGTSGGEGQVCVRVTAEAQTASPVTQLQGLVAIGGY
jgi:hypothetical protein